MKDNPWLPRKRENLRGPAPFGFFIDPDDKLQLLPIEKETKAIEEGFDLLDGGLSFREVAEFVTAEGGRYISHSGLKALWLKHRGHTTPTKQRLAASKTTKSKRMTREQRSVATAKKNAANLKRSITNTKKRLASAQERVQELTGTAPVVKELETIPTEVEDIPLKDNQEVVFKPNPGPQTEFLAASEKEVLYGGAAGGGKSYALLADPMRYFDNPNFRGLILRRTNDELRELVFKARQLYDRAFQELVGNPNSLSLLFLAGRPCG